MEQAFIGHFGLEDNRFSRRTNERSSLRIRWQMVNMLTRPAAPVAVKIDRHTGPRSHASEITRTATTSSGVNPVSSSIETFNSEIPWPVFTHDLAFLSIPLCQITYQRARHSTLTAPRGGVCCLPILIRILLSIHSTALD
jgi:hypothetical protein